MPIRKPIEYQNKSYSQASSDKKKIKQQDNFQEKQRKKQQLGCINIILIAIISVFVFNIGYESFQEFTQIKGQNYSKFLKCIMEFQKSKCDLTNIDLKCQQILTCIENDDEPQFTQIVEIVWDQIMENYLPPFISIVLLLLSQLSQNIKNLTNKDKND